MIDREYARGAGCARRCYAARSASSASRTCATSTRTTFGSN
jgi:hypothetical protein